MNNTDQIQLFQNLFAPKPGEKILFIIDTPHANVHDNQSWKERRILAQEWYATFKKMGDETGFSVDMLTFEATGMHNSPIPDSVIQEAKKANLVIAMTEFSASAPLKPVCSEKNSITRIASMPGVEKRMEETAFKADYAEVKRYAEALEKLLTKAVAAEIVFSTGDHLYMDLRNRKGHSDKCVCKKAGQSINFPSGESCIAPYEADKKEFNTFGKSKTSGVWPAKYGDELVKFVVDNNTIVEIIGNGDKAEEMRRFFAENPTRRNVAELGIGCNPHAVITGNVLEDEKVGLHIAYGKSTHLGGTVECDMHLDIVYAKGCPVEGTTLILINKDGSEIKLIQDAQLRYDLLN